MLYRSQNVLSRRKFYPLKYYLDLKKEQSLLTSRKELEVIIIVIAQL